MVLLYAARGCLASLDSESVSFFPNKYYLRTSWVSNNEWRFMASVGQIHVAPACDLWSSEQPQNMSFTIDGPLHSLFWALVRAS